MEATLLAVESSLRRQASGAALNQPRQRLTVGPDTHVNTMMASDSDLGVFGFKTYTAVGGVYRFFVFLSDSQTGDLVAIVEANRLGQLRTGAASGVAANFMARSDATTVAVLGSGFQARTQLEAVSMVRDIQRVTVYSPNPEHRGAYAAEMSEKLGIGVVAADSAHGAVKGADIVITITSSRTPVLEGAWLESGVCVLAAGGADPYVTELDDAAVRRADLIVVDDRAQSMIESGELMMPAARGLVQWGHMPELWQVVSGQTQGRGRPEDVTLFKSLGMALWDIATAKAVYDRAVDEGAGREM